MRIEQSTKPAQSLTESAQQKVIVVDDDPAQCRILSQLLKAHAFEVRSTVCSQEALRWIEEEPPSFLLTDWEMPSLSGLDLARRVRELNLESYVYVIFLSVRHEQQDVAAALAAGADDFITKPVQTLELLARINAGARVLRREAKLARLAGADALTDLPSRRTFEVVLEREWHQALRHRRSLSCVMLDIDYFKQVNDVYGHAAGDDVLRRFARLLEDAVRDEDYVCRYGGEEFCILLPETGETDAAAWAEGLLARLSESTMAPAARLHVTASCGVAEIAGSMEAATDLVKAADECLLHAKDTGRNRVVSLREFQKSPHAPDGGGASFPQGLLARDAMIPIVHSLGPDCPVLDAAEYLLRFRISGAPVADEAGRLLGIITNRDVLNLATGDFGSQLVVADIVQRNVITYDEQTPLRQVLEFMRRVPVQTVVVTCDQKPTGILSTVGLLRWYLERFRTVSGGEPQGDCSGRPFARRQGDGQRDVVARAELLVAQAMSLRDALDHDATQDDARLAELLSRATTMQELIEELLSSEGRMQREGEMLPF
ncbi:MAG: diguanylate cyclase [Pirellulaceae bacterium]